MADVSDTGTPSLIEWAGGPRATLAIVFTDIVGSTALGVALGDAGMSEVRRAHFARSAALTAQHAGRELKTIGDSVMAVFRSVEAALGYAHALLLDPGHTELHARGVRAGIHIGAVDVVEIDIFGTEVAVAARVVHEIEGAEIWLTDRAKVDLDRGGARHLRHLQWTPHEGIDLKGIGRERLWSVAPAGGAPIQAEAVPGEQHPVEKAQQPAIAVSNIPEGMVPRHFLGRDEALAEIAAALAGGERPVAITAPSVTALHGLRGVGKTVLAAAYAEGHRADYRATWWIRAETESGLRADLVGLAVRLGWVGPDEKEEPALAVVAERLRQEGDGILLIFDSARDADALRPWLPRGGASRIIVTSNAPAWGAVATPVAIRVWPKETGADFLIARTVRQGERAAAEALSETLGGLPLAHEMAASYCDRIGTSFAAYRGKFDAAPVHLLDIDKDAPTEYHDRLTVAKTFALADRGGGETASSRREADRPCRAAGAGADPAVLRRGARGIR